MNVKGTNINDMVCTAPCLAAKKLDWNTSARKQADFNSQEAALGVNGKILSAGWYHIWADNNWGADGNFYLVLSIQGIIQITSCIYTDMVEFQSPKFSKFCEGPGKK